MMSDNCYCGNMLPYSSCCQPIHADLSHAQTAEQLMRARYSAFLLQNVDFIYQTFHTQTRRFQKRTDIENWSKNSHWQGLEIVKTTESTVEFKAFYLDQNLDLQTHHEKSNFKKWNGNWYYVDGKLFP